jgi:hypothetical protein
MDDLNRTAPDIEPVGSNGVGEHSTPTFNGKSAAPVVSLPASILDLDDLTYRHVLFEIVATRRVRYRMAGPLKPRPMIFEEDQE